LLVTDSAAVSNNVVYTLRFANGDEVSASAVIQDEDMGIALLQTDRAEDAVEKKFSTVTLANSDKVRLGQTTLALAGKSSTEVLQGIISSIEKDTKIIKERITEGEETIQEEKKLEYVATIRTNMAFTRSISGSPLINTDGDVIGINLVRDGGVFAVASTMIKELILSLERQENEKEAMVGEEEKTS